MKRTVLSASICVFLSLRLCPSRCCSSLYVFIVVFVFWNYINEYIFERTQIGFEGNRQLQIYKSRIIAVHGGGEDRYMMWMVMDGLSM